MSGLTFDRFSARDDDGNWRMVLRRRAYADNRMGRAADVPVVAT